MSNPTAPSPLWDTVWSSFASSQVGQVADWAIADPLVEIENKGGLQNLDSLGTSILIALFTDAKLPDWMVGQFGFTKADQHEWHGNTFDLDYGEEPLGSLLWTVERMALSDDTARLVEHYAAEALQTLVRQKKVSTFDIFSEVDRVQGRINLRIIAFGPEERTFFASLYPLR